MQSILIVDDMESIHEMLDTVVQPLGFSTLCASNGNDALKIFQQSRPDIVLVDIKMSPMDGLELTRKLKEIDPNAIVIMMSGMANIENALASLKNGAFDFLTKPFKVDQLMSAIARATKQLESQLNPQSEGAGNALIGNSQAIRTLKQTIERVANSTDPALILGEASTQKNLVASHIHFFQTGRQGDSPFVSFDCKESESDVIREQLIGENQQRGPLLESAENGTLFLGNIDALSTEQQGQISDIIRDIKTQTRFIFSTSKNLEPLVESNEFNDSLYYRISSLSVQVPSLRERPGDIPLIANSILIGLDMDSIEITNRARTLLQSYRWPGNYKELYEAVEHSAAQCSDNTIRADDLPQRISDLTSWSKLADYIEEASLEYKRRVLQACQGDAKQAAEILDCELTLLPNA